MTLLAVLFHHRDALEFDLLPARFDTDDIIDGRVSWNKAWRVVSQVLLRPYSHLNASLNGWGFVPDPADVLFANWVDATALMHQQKGKVPPRPISRPWEESRRTRPSVFDPDRGERRAALRERLGLSD